MDEQTVRELWAPTLGDAADWTVLDGEATYRSLPGPQVSAAHLQASETDQPFVRGGEIGRGGVGVVFRARQSSLRRDVALKTPHTRADGGNTASASDFVVEALINGRLEHPNIVPVHDLGRAGEGSLFLAMKLVEGSSWRELLDSQRRDLVSHLEILLQVCNAVAFAHSRGVLHNDLKPENVMVGRFGEVLLMDWGLAVEFGRRARLRHCSQITRPCGTPGYMPPELAEGRGEDLGPHTDVYLLGAILFRLLSGRPPHQGSNFVQTVLHAVLGKLGELPQEVPRELRQICLKALAREPDQRHESVEVFQSELRAFLRHRESLQISRAARDTLDGALARDTLPRSQQYERLATAVAGFAQAQSLWPENPDAGQGNLEARRAYAELALSGGDLALAASQLEALQASGAASDALRGQLEAARQRRARERRLRRHLQWGLASASVLILMLLASWWWAETDRIAEQRALAEADFRRQQRLVGALNGDSLRLVMAGLAERLRRPLDQDRPFHLSSSEQLLHATQIRGFFNYVSQCRRWAELTTPVVEERVLQLMPEAALDSLRAVIQRDHERAVRLAIANQSFELAETILASQPGAQASQPLATELRRQRTSLLRWQILQTERALRDLREGRGRAGRPHWWPTPQEYVIQLSRFRDIGIVQVLAEHLQGYTRRAMAEAEVGRPVPWAQPEREEISVIVEVLGLLELPDACLPALLAFTDAVWDSELAVVGGLALCNTGDRRAEEFIYRELRGRWGANSSVWSQISAKLARIRGEITDARELLDPVECQLQGLRLSSRGEPLAALAMYSRAIELDSTLTAAYNDRGVAFLTLGRDAEAHADFSQAIRLAEDASPMYHNRGLASMAMGQFDAARRDLERAVQLNPQDARAWVSRGSLWLQLDSLDAAVQDYSRAIEIDPQLAAAVNNLAVAYGRLGRLDEAVRMLDRALSLNPSDMMTYCNRALIYLQLNEARRAVADCDQALLLDPSATEALRIRGSAFQELDQPGRALSDYQLAIELGDTSADALAGRGAAALDLGDFDSAERDLRAALAKGLDGGQINYQLGLVERYRRRYDEALALFARALQEEPELTAAYLERASLLQHMGRMDAARTDIDRALALAPYDSAPHIESVELLLRLQDYQGALAAAERALELGVETAELRFWQGKALVELAREHEALFCFERAEQLGQAVRALYLWRSQALQNLERLAPATVALTRAIRADSTDAELWFRRASLYHLQGELSASLADCERSLQLDPEEAEAWALRGGLHQEAGELRTALADFDNFIRLKPGEARGYAMRAQSWWLLQDVPAALADLDHALELQPDLVRARLLRAELLNNQRDLAGALADVDYVLQVAPHEPDAHYMRGTVMRVRKDFAEAVTAFDRAIELRPGHYDALLGRGFCRLMIDDQAGAVADLSLAIEIDTSAAVPYLLRARAHALLGNDLAALADYESCIARDPNNYEALLRSGDLLLRLGRNQEALATLMAALEGGFESGRLRFTLGATALRLGDIETALAHFLRATQLDEELALAPYNAACMLGLLLEQRGDEDSEPERAQAFELLELARQRGYDDLELLRSDSDLDSLRDDPRWPALVERMVEGD